MEVGYGSTCPHCAEPWQPTLQIEISTRGRGAPAAARSTAAIGWGGADAADDAAGGRHATSRESLSSPLLSPTLLLQAIATTHPLIPVCVLIIVDECVPEYLAMSGDERALPAQEIEVALQSVHGQHALGRGWRRARTQFPSIFWNMCWHLASEGLLPLLRHFELDDTRLSPNGYIEVVHAPRRAAAVGRGGQQRLPTRRAGGGAAGGRGRGRFQRVGRRRWMLSHRVRVRRRRRAR